MKPISFSEQNIVIAKDQPEYIPLPAFVDETKPEKPVYTCWELSPDDIADINLSGKLWLKQLTFGGQLQPLLPTTEKPF